MPVESNKSHGVIIPNNNQVENDSLYEQVRILLKENENLKKELRDFKHYILNMLHGFNGLMELEDWDGLRNYFDQMMKSIKPGRSDQAALEKIINYPLKKLVGEKLNKAARSNIESRLFVDESFSPRIDIVSDIDLYEIIDIMIDQAIENAAQGESKKIFLYCFTNEDYTGILVECTYQGKAALPQADTITSKLADHPKVFYHVFFHPQVVVQQLQIVNSAQ